MSIVEYIAESYSAIGWDEVHFCNIFVQCDVSSDAMDIRNQEQDLVSGLCYSREQKFLRTINTSGKRGGSWSTVRGTLKERVNFSSKEFGLSLVMKTLVKSSWWVLSRMIILCSSWHWDLYWNVPVFQGCFGAFAYLFCVALTLYYTLPLPRHMEAVHDANCRYAVERNNQSISFAFHFHFHLV